MLNGHLNWHFLTLIVPDANMWCSLAFKNDKHCWSYDKIKKCNFNVYERLPSLFKSVFFIVTECYDTKLKTGPWNKYFFVKTLQFTNTLNLSKHPNKPLYYKYTTAHQFLTLCFINLRLNHIKILKRCWCLPRCYLIINQQVKSCLTALLAFPLHVIDTEWKQHAPPPRLCNITFIFIRCSPKKLHHELLLSLRLFLRAEIEECFVCLLLFVSSIVELFVMKYMRGLHSHTLKWSYIISPHCLAFLIEDLNHFLI